MTKFESPMIKVVMFANDEVITTSAGYENSSTSSEMDWMSYNTVEGGIDGDFPL